MLRTFRLLIIFLAIFIFTLDFNTQDLDFQIKFIRHCMCHVGLMQLVKFIADMFWAACCVCEKEAQRVHGWLDKCEQLSDTRVQRCKRLNYWWNNHPIKLSRIPPRYWKIDHQREEKVYETNSMVMLSSELVSSIEAYKSRRTLINTLLPALIPQLTTPLS